ncbi:MAG TPA: IS1 family transposase [Stellaceae bacterium]|nr:IS1 family transposase [Stellaceae bacterium]
MNILTREKQVAVISAPTEGCSIRSVERLTNIHRDTIMRLGVRIGDGCAALHNDMMQFVQVNRLELDELWSYVGKKQRQLKPTDPADLGDQYVFLGIDGTRKAIISYRVGKRDSYNTHAFLADFRQRIVNKPEISSDGFFAYPNAVESAFGADCTFGQIIKQYHGEPAIDTARRYSPGVVVGVEYRRVVGAQAKISTSYVERTNLSVRMGSRRFTRLTNAFSKKLANHVAAVSLYVAHFNLCRVHEALRITPALAMGITDHIWSIGELVDAATMMETAEQQAA